MRYFIIFGVTIAIALLILLYPQKYLYKYENEITIDYNNLKDTTAELWTYEINNENCTDFFNCFTDCCFNSFD